MKQLFLFFFLLLSIPFHTSAISLDELQDNPQQYQLIHQSAKYAFFVDSDSIESLRYSPPYYTLKCTSYRVDYLRGVILSSTTNISYNISYRSFNPNRRKMSELGIYISDHYEDIWSLNGNYQSPDSFFDNRNCDIDSPNYHIANYLFYKAYDEYYGPRFENTLY
jgi:hypothetical protein